MRYILSIYPFFCIKLGCKILVKTTLVEAMLWLMMIYISCHYIQIFSSINFFVSRVLS